MALDRDVVHRGALRARLLGDPRLETPVAQALDDAPLAARLAVELALLGDRFARFLVRRRGGVHLARGGVHRQSEVAQRAGGRDAAGRAGRLLAAARQPLGRPREIVLSLLLVAHRAAERGGLLALAALAQVQNPVESERESLHVV